MHPEPKPKPNPNPVSIPRPDLHIVVVVENCDESEASRIAEALSNLVGSVMVLSTSNSAVYGVVVRADVEVEDNETCNVRIVGYRI